MRTFCIYKAVNTLNGKTYIGKTNNFKKRKREHCRYDIDNGLYFHKALKRYGESNFKWEIIDYADTLEDINNLEKYYIEKYNTYKPNGYNLTKGGDGGSMWNAKPIACLTLNGDFVCKYDSAGEAEKIGGFCNSTVLLNCKGKNHSHKGHMFMFYDDYLKFGAKKYIKPESECMRQIIQCDIEGNFINEFKSVKEASEKTGASRTTISGVLSKTYKSAGGYIFVYKEDFPIKDIGVYTKKKRGKKIAQVDINTHEVINVFESSVEAGKYINGSYKAILKVVDMPKRTAYGYRWISQ